MMSSRVNPASRSNESRVPLGMSRLWRGTTARRLETRVVEDEVASRSVIENETFLLQEPDDFARPHGG
jgi:hypothetical protein